MRLRSPSRFSIFDFRIAGKKNARVAGITSPVNRRSARESGVALIVTIIMLSVITFLTVAFLALSGREKGSVKVITDQTTARLTLDAAVNRATADLLTGVLATRNPHQFDLMVSTNYINYAWDFHQSTPLAAMRNPTNVSFTYEDGMPVNDPDHMQQIWANSLYDPRPPVFITNRLTGGMEFRYYLDLNRNGRHDRTGLWPVTNNLGQNIILTNGLILSNYFIGDPEWIGVLERPGLPHSSSNKYTGRYAFVVVPEGKTLDINYIHNQAATRTVGLLDSDGFFRNQGVGPWEINLAAFLADLNTNIWHEPFTTFQYNRANPLTGIGPTAAGNVGLAFDDARAILNYRYDNNYNNLAAGHPSFNTNRIDEYSDGSWMTLPHLLPIENDVTQPWAGSDNPNHFFSLQDVFTKAGATFAGRLAQLGTNLSTYDQNAYYRMLAQLGTASAPEDPDKLNLNYVNVNGCAVTNYILWTDTNRIHNYFDDTSIEPPLFFFTNAVDRLLRKYSQEWLAADRVIYTNLFRMEQSFSLTNIPVIISNQWVYSPAIHRLLQVAANLWETKTGTNVLPAVFRPRFAADTGGTNVYIYGFDVEGNVNVMTSKLTTNGIIDFLSVSNPAELVPPNGDGLAFGVPLVIGAKKGLPNFNEFQSEATFTITRKIQLVKGTSGRIDQTNQFFTMSLNMPSAAEFWNSYASNYARQVDIAVTNRTTMILTNDLGVVVSQTYVTGQLLSSNVWPGFAKENNQSFVVAMRTNVPFLPTVGYLPNLGATGFVSATNKNLFDTSQNLVMPHWHVTISNRVHAMIVDRNTREIIDYVLLGNMTYSTNLTAVFATTPTGSGNAFEMLWATNVSTVPAVGGGFAATGRPGVLQQIRISRGRYAGVALNESEWRNYGSFEPGSVESEVDKFNTFYMDRTPGAVRATIVPFSPTYKFSVPMVWQANDPLVHYMASDLLYLEKSGIPIRLKPATVNDQELEGIGVKNERYRPWNTDPGSIASDVNAYNPAVKDPLVISSDAWEFPTNTLPNVGWIGRVHRGTPWQTIYLKAGNIDTDLTNIVFSPSEWVSPLYRAKAEKWAKWTGNRTLEEGFYTRPVADRMLFDVFTTTLNDNAGHGRLNINQTGLAAWSAVLSGVTYLTNTLTEAQLAAGVAPVYEAKIIEPAGAYDAFNQTTWPPLVRIVEGINGMRANTNFFQTGHFRSLGDILAVRELTDASPFLNRGSVMAQTRGVTDAVYEWLPQQIMSLLHLEESPRFAIYAYGQTLQPAPDSILLGGPFAGMCTNYAITAETAARVIVRVEGSLDPANTNHENPKKRYPPRAVIESFNYLPPE